MKAWKYFETKKEGFCNFLSKAEIRASSFPESLSRCKDFSVIQNGIATHQVRCEGALCGCGCGQHYVHMNTPPHAQVFVKETSSYQQKLSELNQLAQDLVTNRHSNDDTRDLEDMMSDLNSRWRNVIDR